MTETTTHGADTMDLRKTLAEFEAAKVVIEQVLTIGREVLAQGDAALVLGALAKCNGAAVMSADWFQSIGPGAVITFVTEADARAFAEAVDRIRTSPLAAPARAAG